MKRYYTAPTQKWCSFFLLRNSSKREQCSISIQLSNCLTLTLAWSKRSDSGVKKAMKSGGGTPSFLFFARLFTSHCSPLSERLEQATLTWDATSRNGKRHAWWPKCVVTPSPREIGAQLIAFWRFLLLIICTCTQQIFVRGGSAPRSNPLPVEKAFYICDWFLFYDSAGFQQLKGIQSSKQGMWKEYHLSIEGIRNREKWYIKG